MEGKEHTNSISYGNDSNGSPDFRSMIHGNPATVPFLSIGDGIMNETTNESHSVSDSNQFMNELAMLPSYSRKNDTAFLDLPKGDWLEDKIHKSPSYTSSIGDDFVASLFVSGVKNGVNTTGNANGQGQDQGHQQGTFGENGTPMNGTPMNGTPVNGTPVNGTPVNGTPVNGTLINDTPINGTLINGNANLISTGTIPELDNITTIHPDFLHGKVNKQAGEIEMLTPEAEIGLMRPIGNECASDLGDGNFRDSLTEADSLNIPVNMSSFMDAQSLHPDGCNFPVAHNAFSSPSTTFKVQNPTTLRGELQGPVGSSSSDRVMHVDPTGNAVELNSAAAVVHELAKMQIRSHLGGDNVNRLLHHTPPGVFKMNPPIDNGVPRRTSRRSVIRPSSIRAMGAGPSSMGTMGAGSSSMGAMGAGSSSMGAMGAGPSSMGTMGAGPSSMGAIGAGPSSMGAMGAGPSSMGTIGAGPSSMGAMGAGPSSMGTMGAGSSSMGAMGAGPSLMGTMGAGPSSRRENVTDETFEKRHVSFDEMCRTIATTNHTLPNVGDYYFAGTVRIPDGTLAKALPRGAAGKKRKGTNGVRKMSKREAARTAMAIEHALEAELAMLVQAGQITDADLLRLRPKKPRRAATFEKPTASRFCHICSRTPKNVGLAPCSKIKRGVCRKSICEKCFAEHQLGNFEDALDAEKSNWVCPHCVRACPRRAQCHTYQRINDQLRACRLKGETLEQKRLARARRREMNAPFLVNVKKGTRRPKKPENPFASSDEEEEEDPPRRE